MASKPFSSGHILAAADVNDLVGIIDRSTAEVDVVNDASSEHEIYSNTVAAGAMSTDRMLRCSITGDYLNNTGGGVNLVLRVYLGGTLILVETLSSIGAAATRRRFRLWLEIMNRASASVQDVSGELVIGSSVAAAVGEGEIGALQLATGAASMNAGVEARGQLGAAAAINTGVAVALAVTVQHSTASSSLSFRKRRAILELL